MSYTRIINQNQQQLTFRVSVTPSLEQRVEELVRQMGTASFFDEELREKIEQWKERLLQEGPEEAPYALCFLLFKVVRPELKVQEGNEPNEDLLLAFEDEIRGLLSQLGIEADSFIDKYEELLVEESTVQEKVEEILSCFQSFMQELYRDANGVNQQMAESFEKVRQKLRELNRNREAIGEALHPLLETLATRVERAHQASRHAALDIAATGKRYEDFRAVYDQLIDECNSMLSRV